MDKTTDQIIFYRNQQLQVGTFRTTNMLDFVNQFETRVTSKNN